MKKIIVLTILIVAVFALFSAGCAPKIRCEAPSKIIGDKCCLDSDDNGVCDASEQKAVQDTQPQPVPQEPSASTEPETQTEQSPDTEVQEPAPEETKDKYQDYVDSLSAPERTKLKVVRQLVQKALNSEENYFYRYSTPTVLQREFWVRGDKMKIQFLDADRVDKFNYYNMVFLDLSKGTIEGYCETGGKAKCWKGHGPFPETANHYRLKTPKDWLKEFGDEFRYASQNKIRDVLYYIVDYDRDDGVYRVWINSWKGWPYRIEFFRDRNPAEGKKPDKRWVYEDMDIGAVMEEDVTPDSSLASS